MKNLILTGTILTAAMLFTACDPQPARQKPAHAGGGMREPATEKTPSTDERLKTEKKEPKLDSENPAINGEHAKPETKIPPVGVPNPEYGKKAEGKAGFIESPYAPGKLIDVRGLPPGTEIECPYTRKPLLVP